MYCSPTSVDPYLPIQPRFSNCLLRNLTPASEALGTDSNKRVIENNYFSMRYVLDKNKFNSDKYRIVSNAFIEVTPLPGLMIRSQASVDYQNGTDYQLTFVAVPEPSTWAMMLGGLGILNFYQRTRRNRNA